MRTILLKSACLLLLLFAVDRILGFCISRAAGARQLDQRLEKLLQGRIAADIMILGSSRAARNIIGSEIEKASGLSTFNLGYPGSNIDFHEMLLRLMIKSGLRAGKIVLAVDDDAELIEDPTINFRFDVLYPHLYDEAINREICERKKLKVILTRISLCYRQRPNVKQALQYVVKGRLRPDPLSNIEEDGSMPIDGKSVTYGELGYGAVPRIYDKGRESIYLREKFRSVVELCRQSNIKLIILFSPNFFRPTDGFQNRMRELGGKNAQYIDLSIDFLEKELYYDGYHLDRKGAILFSKALGESIRRCL